MNKDDNQDSPSKYKLVVSINCKSFDTFIIDFLDGNLQEDQKLIFTKHLNECAPCKKYLENYKKSVQLSQSAFSAEQEVDKQEMPEELVQAILASKK
jgi:anti-sigma factor RsiW